MLTASEFHIDFIQMVFAVGGEGDRDAGIGAAAALVKLDCAFG